MNAFRLTNGSLDRKYLRTCAVYRLLIRRRIGKVRALELLRERHGTDMRAIVEIWNAWPIKGMLP